MQSNNEMITQVTVDEEFCKKFYQKKETTECKFITLEILWDAIKNKLKE